ncbi:MAG: hypothetical protein OSA81_07845 [Longimicrobiales bacterium]|nr:hypothetical protein [Longimicrobiales bacterium]
MTAYDDSTAPDGPAAGPADYLGFEGLFSSLEARFGAEDRSGQWSDGEFSSWALVSFKHQFSTCDPYRAFCVARGVTPESVASWEDVPAVPAAAFKYFDFLSAEGRQAEAVFQTSGTTRGGAVRGRHLVPSLDLYRASLTPPLRAALLPDVEQIRMVSLIPDPEEVPDSSLSFMVGEAVSRFATQMDWLVGSDGRWGARSSEMLDSVRSAGEPVLVLGTALSFLHVMERGRDGLAGLPDGSRIMETGGFKGVRREVPRDQLYAAITEHTGVPPSRIVNEYGMTELLSQLWEPVLAEGLDAVGVHVPAPWLRVRALDATTLAPMPEGDDGILCFFDLANLGSVSHVLTEDVGSVMEGRVRLRGRAPGAESRGCSRAMDDLMSAVDDR